MLPRGGGGGKVGVHGVIFPDGQTGSARHWRSVTPMKTGDTVADFELPDQTGAPRRLSALLSDGPVVLFFYPAAMTARVHQGSVPFPRPGAGVRRRRRKPGRDQRRPGRQAGRSSPKRSVSTIHCCPTPTARSQPIRCQARAFGQAGAGQAHDLRHRHRPQGARRDLQRVEHGLPRGQGVADAASRS